MGALPKITIVIDAPVLASAIGVGYPDPTTEIMPVTWRFEHDGRKHATQHNGIVIDDKMRANPTKLHERLHMIVGQSLDHAWQTWNAIHDPTFPRSADAPPACTNPDHVIITPLTDEEKAVLARHGVDVGIPPLHGREILVTLRKAEALGKGGR